MASLVTMALGAGHVHAESISRTLTAKHGMRVAIDSINALEDDCSPGPFPDIRIQLTPAHGIVRAGAARYPIATNHSCPNADSRLLAISYFPYPNFVGEDVNGATITLPNGEQNAYRWMIMVVPQVQSGLVAVP